MERVESLTPREYAERWPTASAAEDAVLLDVREPAELALAAISFAERIPMGEIPARYRELDNNKTIVVMCHSGVRSLQVAHYLMAHGFARVINLAGGIDAWSQQIDSSIPRY
jgi:rhodanese-related sulfurtransferase